MKKKLLRNASLVALSAVMVCGTAIGLAGCGDDSNTIKISMFCGVDDRVINETACNTWAEQYTQEMIASGEWEEGHAPITIDFDSNADPTAYFTALSNQISSNSQPDIFYVSPKYVRVWSHYGRVLDLADYLTSEEDVNALNDVWDDALAFYAYTDAEGYQRGERIEFADGAWKGQQSGVEVGIYGLPKDFSNFGLSFNATFFTDEIRDALTTKKTSDRNGTMGAEFETGALTFNAEYGVVTDEDGNDVPLIQIGVPTYYKPYNFYKFPSYEDALIGGDPVAWLVDEYTDGQGYCVTIPGFPGDTFEEAKEYWPDGANTNVEIPADYKNTEAEYDEDTGYITYTYAEYSALTWVLTYYYNTYNWDNYTENRGGRTTPDGRKNIYGNDQYESVYYLLPWLAGNNADYINQDSTSVTNGDDPTVIGTETYTTQQVNIQGVLEDIAIQFGTNSEAYVETLGAFYAYGSDWNGNSNNCGDTTSTKPSGWDMFCLGQVVFYGKGTWDAISTNRTDRSVLAASLMPEPVSEDYALYSYIKDADYNMVTYTDGEKQDGYVSPAKTEYTGQEIFENQLERQDKWGARMDSVGYGISTAVLDDAEWKLEACIDLMKYLTIGEEMQVTLTYSGSQLPNFKSQCLDFLDGKGAFEEMVTPDDAEFDSVYQIAKDMYAVANTAGGTVGEWMAQNHPDVAYDKQFENTPMKSVNSLAYGMKVLYLTLYTYEDRDLSVRMQFGLNFVRDSTMYTYETAWLTSLDARGKNYVLPYLNQAPHTGDMVDWGTIFDTMLTSSDVSANPDAIPEHPESYATPGWWAVYSTREAQRLLDVAIQTEKDMLS